VRYSGCGVINSPFSTTATVLLRRSLSTTPKATNLNWKTQVDLMLLVEADSNDRLAPSLCIRGIESNFPEFSAQCCWKTKGDCVQKPGVIKVETN